MDEKERLQVLEQALAQMLKPVKGIPFSVIAGSHANGAATRSNASLSDLSRAIEEGVLR